MQMIFDIIFGVRSCRLELIIPSRRSEVKGPKEGLRPKDSELYVSKEGLRPKDSELYVSEDG